MVPPLQVRQQHTHWGAGGTGQGGGACWARRQGCTAAIADHVCHLLPCLCSHNTGKRTFGTMPSNRWVRAAADTLRGRQHQVSCRGWTHGLHLKLPPRPPPCCLQYPSPCTLPEGRVLVVGGVIQSGYAGYAVSAALRSLLCRPPGEGGTANACSGRCALRCSFLLSSPLPRLRTRV